MGSTSRGRDGCPSEQPRTFDQQPLPARGFGLTGVIADESASLDCERAGDTDGVQRAQVTVRHTPRELEHSLGESDDGEGSQNSVDSLRPELQPDRQPPEFGNGQRRDAEGVARAGACSEPLP